jgi:hypothetical protein
MTGRIDPRAPAGLVSRAIGAGYRPRPAARTRVGGRRGEAGGGAGPMGYRPDAAVGVAPRLPPGDRQP